jgi:hypothetical protein
MSRRSPVDGESRLQFRFVLRLCAAGRVFFVERQLIVKAGVGRFPWWEAGPLRKPTFEAEVRSRVRLLVPPIAAVDPFQTSGLAIELLQTGRLFTQALVELITRMRLGAHRLAAWAPGCCWPGLPVRDAGRQLPLGNLAITPEGLLPGVASNSPSRPLPVIRSARKIAAPTTGFKVQPP